MSQHQPFFQHIRALHIALNNACQRRIVVLSGSPERCFSVMDKVSQELGQTSPLFVSDFDHVAAYLAKLPHLASLSFTPANKLKHCLGQEVDTLIWDGFSGLNPDALGIASGLLKGGGIFFLLLPDFEVLIKKGDADYLRMCSDHQLLDQCHTFFMQRLVRHLQGDPDVLIYPVDQPQDFQPAPMRIPPVNAPELPTQDQLSALHAIIKTAKGHRYRPLVLLADRGRGKSSTLGMAAARLNMEHGYKIAICAPDKSTCLAAFAHYRRTILEKISDSSQLQTALDAFDFVPMDQLPEKSAEYHMLMIDEAAALPTPLLKLLLGIHPRLVFATTLHGYEGHGQGFAIRFKQTLDHLAPQWKALTLHSPVRWLENDVVEQWFFRFLLLKTSVSKQLTLNAASKIAAPIHVCHSDIKIIWVRQAELHADDALLEAVFSLLVSAHYQTKPSDLRLILDHPHIQLAVAMSTEPDPLKTGSGVENKQLVGVMLILEEGGLDNALATGIINGTRRPRGHLFPQALCAFSGRPECLIQRSYRITRIAVNQQARQQGIGSALLDAAHKLAQENKVDSLSSSFGLRPEMISFWTKNRFEIVKLGLHTDGASSTQSVMLMQPISEAALELSTQLGRQFESYFLFNLSRLYKSLDSQDCLSILYEIATKAEIQKQVSSALRAFAFAKRSFEESYYDVFQFFFASLRSPNWRKLDSVTVDLVVMKVFQGHDNEHCSRFLQLKGKKDIEQRLRMGMQKLLA